MKMIKNSFKFIVLIILVIITSTCSSNSNSFWGFKPHFSTGTYIHSYAIIENGKINRMGIPKKDIDKMDSIINDTNVLFAKVNYKENKDTATDEQKNMIKNNVKGIYQENEVKLDSNLLDSISEIWKEILKEGYWDIREKM